jgi:hypothetical protein
MNDTDLDGGGGNVQKRYTSESNIPCNFGGITLGKGGESVDLITIDDMHHDNIGFIHCDAQGAETYIFSKGTEMIIKQKPVIFFENNINYGKYLVDCVHSNYPQYIENRDFNIVDFCKNQVGYKYTIDRYNGSIDTLLLP